MKANESFIQYVSRLTADADIPRWSGYMPDKLLGDLKFYDLPPVLRALLIADGTVTMSIEAIYREPVQVQALGQEFMRAPCSIPALSVNCGDNIFFREVVLRGEHSGKVYVKACSLLRQESIDGELWAQLRSEKIGMGVVLRSAAESSFREVLHIGAGDLSGADGFVHRSYSVRVGGTPTILITEVFDLDVFASGYR